MKQSVKNHTPTSKHFPPFSPKNVHKVEVRVPLRYPHDYLRQVLILWKPAQEMSSNAGGVCSESQPNVTGLSVLFSK